MSGTTEDKKLVSVSATSASVTRADKEVQKMILDQVPYIYYLVSFRKDKKATIWALINLNSKVNAMTPAYAK